MAGAYSGNVRTLTDDRDRVLKEVGPSTPVQVTGLSGVPQAGDSFLVVQDASEAREITAKRGQIKRMYESRRPMGAVTLERVFDRIKEGQIKELRLIIKGDVDGSVEVLSDTLGKIYTDEVKTNIIRRGVGGITESDTDGDGVMDMFVDIRGNEITMDNPARPSDFVGGIDDMSLHFNPNDEASLWSRYTLTEGPLKRLGFGLGVRYYGPAQTSIPIGGDDLGANFAPTPDAADRWRFDAAVYYNFNWLDANWRLSLNIYNLADDTVGLTMGFMGAQYLATIPLESENSEGWSYGDKHEGTAWLSYEWKPTFVSSARLRYESQGEIQGIDPKIFGPGLGADPHSDPAGHAVAGSEAGRSTSP